MLTVARFDTQVRQVVLNSGKVTEEEILVHTSKSGDDVKKQLVDVDALWTKYRLVLYSPTISAGVDFSSEHFDRMYLYVCPLSCAPMGTLQMTGRVRTLRDSTVECCTAANMRLAGAASRRAVTFAETMKFLRWMDSRIQEKQLLTRQLKRVRVARYEKDDADEEDVVVCGSVTLPEESPLLALQARERSERENAGFRFFFEFRDMAVEAGHDVTLLSDMSLTEEALVQMVMDEASQPSPAEGEPDGLTYVVGKMLEGAQAAVPVSDDMSADEYFRQLEARVHGNQATEEDKWSHYARSYSKGWGLDRIDDAFLRAHGIQPKCPKVAQLIRVLYPPLCAEASLESSVSARQSILRTSLIREVLQALGVASPFDTEHVIPDLMQVFDAGLKDTLFFREYKECAANVFDVNARTSAWVLRSIVNALGVVLGSIGLKLESVRKQGRTAGKKTETYSYSLDAERCAEMLELVRIKLRNSDYRAATPNAHARELLLRDEFPKYGHLLDMERGGRSAYGFIDV
jgi:hypothetical protein